MAFVAAFYRLNETILPLHCTRSAPFYAVAVTIHGAELLHRFLQPFFCGGREQFFGFCAVCLHVDAAQIGKSDKVVVAGVLHPLGDGDLLEAFCQHRRQLGVGVGVGQGGQLGIVLVQQCTVGFHQLDGQDGLLFLDRQGIFGGHHIIGLVYQIGCDGKHEQSAFFQRRQDRLVEVLARCQELVVPDGDVPAEGILMDQPHQRLGVTAVFFAVAKEDVGVKGASDLLRQLVSDQHRGEVFLQLFVKTDGGGIGVAFVEKLQIAADCVESFCQSRLLHKRKNRDIFLFGKVKFRKSPMVAAEKTGGDGDHEQVHLLKIAPEIDIGCFGRSGVVPHRAILMAQKILCDLRKIGLPIVGMTAKIHPRLAVGRGVVAGLAV